MYNLVRIGVPMIIGEIRRYLRDNNSIRVSRSLRDLAYKVLAIRDREMKINQREIGIEEMAKELGVQKEEITMCLDAIQEPISLRLLAFSYPYLYWKLDSYPI